MKTLASKILPFLFAIFLLSSCAAPSALSGLSLSLADIQPTSATRPETQFTLTLRFVNENEAAAAISWSTHKLYLNGTYIGTAVTHEALALPRLKTETQKISFHLDPAATQKVLAFAGNATATYRLESEVFLDVGEDQQKMKLPTNGQIDVHAFVAAVSAR